LTKAEVKPGEAEVILEVVNVEHMPIDLRASARVLRLNWSMA